MKICKKVLIRISLALVNITSLNSIEAVWNDSIARTGNIILPHAPYILSFDLAIKLKRNDRYEFTLEAFSEIRDEENFARSRLMMVFFRIDQTHGRYRIPKNYAEDLDFWVLIQANKFGLLTEKRHDDLINEKIEEVIQIMVFNYTKIRSKKLWCDSFLEIFQTNKEDLPTVILFEIANRLQVSNRSDKRCCSIQ